MNLHKPIQKTAAAIVSIFMSLSVFSEPVDMPDNRQIYSYIEDIVGFGSRHTGSQAMKNTTNYISGKFSEFGLENVEILKGNSQQWSIENWSLSFGNETIPSFYMRHTFYDGTTGSFSTPEKGLNADIVYIGDSKDLSSIDVKGKIVVADIVLGNIDTELLQEVSSFVYDPENSMKGIEKLNPFTPNNYPYNMASAIEGGAVGFIGILSNYFDSNRFYNEDISYFISEDYHFDIPGLWISKRDGDTLKALIQRSPGTQAKIVMKGRVEEVEYRTVVGHLKGQTDDILMVQSHHDSGFFGAVEDASGVAEVLALAKYFARQAPNQRNKSMMFVTMDTHFTDYVAHEDLANKVILENNLNVLANVTVEHIAREVEVTDGQATLSGNVEPRLFITSPSLLDMTARAVKSHQYDRSMVIPTAVFADDYGLPTDVGVIQLLTDIPVVSLISVPAYLYDMADTLDKVAFDQLQPTALLLADLLESMHHSPVDTFQKDKLLEQ